MADGAASINATNRDTVVSLWAALASGAASVALVAAVSRLAAESTDGAAHLLIRADSIVSVST